MAGVTNPVTVRMDNRRIPAPTAPLLLQRLGDLLRMHFVSLKYLQTRLEKVLQFCVASIGNEHRLKRIVDCLVIGNFVVCIGLVERRALQFLEFGLFPPA